jgi:hypothetical protein
MEFGVIHEISDPQAWQDSLDAAPSWPDDFSLLSFVEAEDKSRALCVWRAPSQAILQEYLDRNLGRGTVNIIFPVALRHFQDPGI